MYVLYELYHIAYKESLSLERIAKMKFDKEHKERLGKYPEMRERLQNVERKLQNESRQQGRQESRVKRREEEI